MHYSIWYAGWTAIRIAYSLLRARCTTWRKAPGILLDQQTVPIPVKRRIREQDINLIRQDRTGSGTILAVSWNHRASAEGVAQFIPQLFQQALVDWIR